MSDQSTSSTAASPGPSGKSCPNCGAAIPAEAPQGLCPKCLLQQASFPTETGATTRHTRPAPPDRDELARAFPHLQILELIGQGGMGFVYKARQPKLDRIVALKILAQPLAEQTHFAERFTREGRTLAKLNHPNIVTIHDFGQAGPFFYLLMEYVDGVNLRQAMRAGAINADQALAIVPRICEALQYAHNEGVLHRDIKPDNILLDTRGRVKIADFGIAKLMAEAVAENPLTGSGASLGTPHYMAPEQIEKPNAVDHRADIYSLGVVFYEMLTGELPLGRFAAPSEKSAIDPRLDEVVFQTLEKQPERRPQSADEVKTKVENITSAPSAQSDPKSKEAVTFKMSHCYIAAPEFLQTWIGRLFRYNGKGDVRLDEDNLTFAPHYRNWIVIPLRAITGLSLIEMPARFLKRLRSRNLIAVTFTEKGIEHRVLLCPNRGAFRPIWQTNQHVEQWFKAIQRAIKAKTNHIPPSSPNDAMPLPITAPELMVSREPNYVAWIFAIFLTFCLFLLGVNLLSALTNRREPQPSRLEPTVARPNPSPDVANPTTGPTKTLNLAFDSVSQTPNHNINFKAETDLAGNEQISAALRYNDNDWSFTRYTATWLSNDRLLRLHWELPDNFSVPFDLEPAVNRYFSRRQTVPVLLSTNEPIALFTVTNSLNQRITCGIRYDVSETASDSFATISHLTVHSTVGRMELYVQASVPPGMMLVAYGDAAGSPTSAVVKRDMPSENTTIRWSYPQDSMSSAFPELNGEQSRSRRPVAPIFFPPFTGVAVQISTNPIPVFSLTNMAGKVFRGFIALAPTSTPNGDSIFVSPPPQAKAAATSGAADTLDLTFIRRSIEPRKIILVATGMVTLDDAIGTLTRRPETQSEQRRGFGNIPPPPSFAIWRCARGMTNEDVAEFVWTFAEPYSMEGDLGPAVDRFFAGADQKTVQLSADRFTSLFTVTNAFGEPAECGLYFKKHPVLVKNPNAGAIITAATGSADYTGIVLNVELAFPKDIDIQATGRADNNSSLAVLTRPLDASSTVNIKWFYPEGFPVPNLNANSPSGVAPPQSPPNKPFQPFLRPLLNRIDGGDARVTASKSLEVFAITNSQGQVFRGFLEISHGK